MKNNTPVPVLIALGANLADRAKQIETAWRKITDSHHIKPLRLSKIISTRPVGGSAGQPDFLNGVGLLETTLDPFELLDLLQKTEAEGDRQRHEFWGARTIDLDLLLYGQTVLRSERLILPHPRIVWRPFVLEPAAEIAPDMVHPLWHRTLGELAELARMNFRLAAINLWELPRSVKSFPF
ncbi:MAG: 2-amino-4-hydroxy-6-hydroxymethyldihydropteridine diphosphokinase [Thermoguttaceae bacterium]|jgi:2-amino-4-hydroxy-6-hydroxymethyldihydropteridine diphosphokinase